MLTLGNTSQLQFPNLQKLEFVFVSSRLENVWNPLRCWHLILFRWAQKVCFRFEIEMWASFRLDIPSILHGYIYIHQFSTPRRYRKTRSHQSVTNWHCCQPHTNFTNKKVVVFIKYSCLSISKPSIFIKYSWPFKHKVLQVTANNILNFSTSSYSIETMPEIV